MGAWGPESCSSDSCWDYMGSLKDIHEPKQEEVIPCLDAVLADEYDSEYYPRAKFGVVIWLLDHGMTIPDNYLEWASTHGQELLDRYMKADSVAYADSIEALTNELVIVRTARERGGKGEERHVKGLGEQIGEMLAGGDIGLINKPG